MIMAVNPPPLPPAADHSDIARLIVNAAIIIASFLTVLVTLHYVLTTPSLLDSTKTLNASTIVAVLGAVTTFLGTAVGVFFGVNVGQAGTAAATQASNASAAAANVASSAAQSATTAAAGAAQTANGAAQAASDAAATAKDANAAAQSTSDQVSKVQDAVAALASAVPQDTLDALGDTHKQALKSFLP